MTGLPGFIFMNTGVRCKITTKQWRYTSIYISKHKSGYHVDINIKERNNFEVSEQTVRWRPSIDITYNSYRFHLTFFRVTAPSWGESIGHRWIPLMGASDAELWRFLWPAPQQTVKTNNGDADYLRRHRSHHDVTAMLFMKLKLIALACINSLPFIGANSNRCIMPYDLPISANYAESKLRYKFHMFLLCCMYHIGSNRDIPKVDLIAI